MLTLAFSISSSARIITLITDSMGTGTYGASSRIAQIINKYNTVGLNVKTKLTIGSTELAGLLPNGEGQSGVYNSVDAQFSWLTKANFQVYDKVTKVIPFESYLVELLPL